MIRGIVYAWEFVRAFGFVPFAVVMFFLGVSRVSKLFESSPLGRDGEGGQGAPKRAT